MYATVQLFVQCAVSNKPIVNRNILTLQNYLYIHLTYEGFKWIEMKQFYKKINKNKKHR